LLRRVQSTDSFDFAHLESAYAEPLILQHKLQNIDSVIVVFEGKVYTKSNAILKIITQISWPYRGLYVLVVIPRFIRDWLYDIVANNRHKWFGRSKNLTCDFLIKGGDTSKDKPRNT